MSKAIDLTGRVFGYWTVISKTQEPEKFKGTHQQWWLCRCKCGKESIRKGGQLLYAERKGIFQSCNSCAARLADTTHGLSKTPEYKIWISMVERCTLPTAQAYKHYGARGITVSDDWMKFENFLRDMGERPFKGASLDRIDNNKGYSKENCRWTTPKVQNRNKRDNVWIEYNGKRQTLSQWAEETGLSQQLIRQRIKIYGYTVEEALTHPVYGKRFNQRSDAEKLKYNGQERTIKEWSQIYGQNSLTIASRLRRGWPVEEAIGAIKRKRH